MVTRENNRLLATGRRWVKNGDRWVVRATKPDGTMAVRRLDGQGEVVLPADYVRQYVELAYATTAYRAQGRTVATAHALVSPTTTREVLYVSATRGREENRLYVDTCFDRDPPTSHPGLARPQSPREVLAAVLAREGAEPSAHEALRRAEQEAQSFTVMAAEYSTIAGHAQQQRFSGLLGRCQRARSASVPPARAVPTVRSWLPCGTPRRVASTSKARYRGWLRPGHWPGLTTP